MFALTSPATAAVLLVSAIGAGFLGFVARYATTVWLPARRSAEAKPACMTSTTQRHARARPRVRTFQMNRSSDCVEEASVLNEDGNGLPHDAITNEIRKPRAPRIPRLDFSVLQGYLSPR
uniref:Uncharacterized protein n=1 Tax=Haptolina ericina TaxID=156174 RepID=A0A7S3B3B1_9EUKA